MPVRPGAVLGLLVLAGSAAAQTFNDADLSGGARPDPRAPLRREELRGPGTPRFQAERVSPSAPGPADAATLSGRIFLVLPDGAELPARAARVFLAGSDSAATETDAEGNWTLPRGAGSPDIRFRLENRFWSIRDPRTSAPYEWAAASGAVRLDPGTANGRIGFIHAQFLEALSLFEREGLDLAWWDKRLSVNYPGNSDFFSRWGFSVDLTRAEAWDVNLHELGHAVQAAGTRSRGGGGEHKIDECYDRGLAWSEGFATFFAGAVRLRGDDPDAKFEYLVPRRAPIRLELVPGDVCAGDTNEWRVASALWDLHDSNADGADLSRLGFARLWRAWREPSLGGLPDAWAAVRKTLSAAETAAAEAALRQNTVLPAVPAPRLAALEGAGSRPAFSAARAPAWDGR